MLLFGKKIKRSGAVHYYAFGIRVWRRESKSGKSKICDPLFSHFYKNKTNWIRIIKQDGTVIENPETVAGLEIYATGDNNHIIIHEPFKFNQVKINSTGDIDITFGANSTILGSAEILKIRNTAHNNLIIGQNFSCGSAKFDLCDAGDIIIGDDNMWSIDIYLKSDDTHAVFDNATGTVLNKSTQINIGNHVWIGMRSFICKNSIISDFSIVGACSVVAGKFKETNCVIAGNPAQVRKQNINWSRMSINEYIQNNQQ